MTDEGPSRIGARIDKCAELRNARWMRSYLSADRKRMFCELEAPDAESVREAYRTAGVQFVGAWAAELYKRQPVSGGR